MTWDPVPWMVGGGAEHSTNVARNVAYAAFGGIEGIASPAACEVRELAVPGTSVRVFPGTVAIENRAAGAFDEMYVGRLPAEDTVAIAATDGTGGRSDMIIAVVENPHLPGEPYQAPADPTVGPYIYTRVVSNVPATATKISDLASPPSAAIPLARIDLPASTGTVTQSMITDLRRLSKRESSRTFKVIEPVASETLTGAGFSNWPTAAFIDVDVPSWATHVKMKATLGGIAHGDPGASTNTRGSLRLVLEGAASTENGASVAYNVAVGSGVDRAVFFTGEPGLAIPAGNRGRPATIRLQGNKAAGDTTLTADDASLVDIDVEFVNAAESNV